MLFVLYNASMSRSLALEHFLFVGTVILVSVLIVSPLQSHAESVMWSETFPGIIQQKNKDLPGGRVNFRDPNVTIEYRATIKHATTGVVVPPGGSVLVGTPLELAFDPHVSADISWFAVGANYDSPYGDWRANAAPPSSFECLEKDFVGVDLQGGGKGHVFANLSVDPPVKNITGTQGLTCGAPSSSGSLSCTAQTVGAVPAVFSFVATKGSFYAQLQRVKSGAAQQECFGSNVPMQIKALGNANALPVPLRSISYPITVIDSDGSPPGSPSIAGSGACVVGTPYSITMSATDSDNDQIRYGIDWDANGMLDQFVPSSGFVSSGTSQTASRTYATAGAKTVKILAQDDEGLTSGWSTFSFSCTGASIHQAAFFDGGTNSGTGSNVDSSNSDAWPSSNISIRAIPSLVRPNQVTRIRWSASHVSRCSVTGSNNNAFGPFNAKKNGIVTNEPDGTDSVPIFQQTTYTLTCVDTDGSTLTQSTTVSINPVWNED